MSYQNIMMLIEKSSTVQNFKQCIEFVEKFELIANESSFSLKNKDAVDKNLSNFRNAIRQFLKLGSNEVKELVAFTFSEDLSDLDNCDSVGKLVESLKLGMNRHNPRVTTELEHLIAATKLDPFSVTFRSDWILFQERLEQRDIVSHNPWDPETRIVKVGATLDNQFLLSLVVGASAANCKFNFEYVKKQFDFIAKIKFNLRGKPATPVTETANVSSEHRIVPAPIRKTFEKPKAKAKAKSAVVSGTRCSWCNGVHKINDCIHRKANRTCLNCGGKHLKILCKKPENANMAAEFSFMADYVNLEAETPIYTCVNDLDTPFVFQDIGEAQMPIEDEEELVDDTCYVLRSRSSSSRNSSKRVKLIEDQPNIVSLIVDSGCSFPIFGRMSHCHLKNIRDLEKSFNTANGVVKTSKVGDLIGLARDLEGNEVKVVITGALSDNMEISLLPAKEALLTQGKVPWVAWMNVKYTIGILGNSFKLLVKVDENALISTEKSETMTDKQRSILIRSLLDKWSYLDVSEFGEKLSDHTLDKALRVAIRHLHVRLSHNGPDSLHATCNEHGVTWLPHSFFVDLLKGCKWCMLKKTHVSKFAEVLTRGVDAKKTQIDQTNENKDIDVALVVDHKQISNRKTSYEGIALFPGHTIMQDVSYLVDGVHNSRGFTLIIDLHSKFVMGNVVHHKKDTKSEKLTEETLDLLSSWCSAKGSPSIVKTDNGSEFCGIYSQFLLKRGIDQQNSAPYTPQQQGAIERINGIIKKLIALLLLKFNWPVNHWPLVFKSAIEIYNITASKSVKCSPFAAWYGIPPSFKLIPGDRVTVNIKDNPGLISEDLDKFNLRNLFCTYVFREGRIAQVAIMTKTTEVSTAYVPMKQLGIVRKNMHFVGKEASGIFVEPRSIDKTMTIINNQEEYSEWKLDSYDWDADSEICDIKFTPEKRGRIDLTEQRVIRIEEAIIAGRDSKSQIVTQNEVYNAIEQLKKVEGKTHCEVTDADIAKGTHNTAMNSELEQFVKNSVFGKEISVAEAKKLGYKVIGARWVHSWKLKNATRVPKSRLVARGFLDKEDVDVYVDVPTGKFRRVALIVGLMTKKKAFVADVKTAFLQAPIPDTRKIAIKLPSVLPKDNPLHKEAGTVMILTRAMYGLQDSPRVFCMWLANKLEKLGWKSIGWGIFVKRCKKDNSYDIIVSYVDDLWFWSDHAQDLYKEIAKIVMIDDIAEIGDDWTRYIGVDVKFSDKMSKIITSITSYVEGIEIPKGIKGFIRDSDFPIVAPQDSEIDSSLIHEMQSIVGKIGYVAMNHPGLSFIYGELSRYTTKATQKLLDLAYRVGASIVCHPPVDLPYTPVTGEGEIRVWTDASLRRQGLSGVGRSGFIIQYVNKDSDLKERGNYLHWGSAVDKRSHPSTSSAEISAMIMGLREAVDIARCIHKLTEKTATLKVLIDAKVVEDQLRIGKAKANPFDQANVDYVIQCLEDMKLYGISNAYVVHVDTKSQKADGLTKYIRGIWTTLEAFLIC